jgi:hypothetical protein
MISSSRYTSQITALIRALVRPGIPLGGVRTM